MPAGLAPPEAWLLGLRTLPSCGVLAWAVPLSVCPAFPFWKDASYVGLGPIPMTSFSLYL